MKLFKTVTLTLCIITLIITGCLVIQKCDGDNYEVINSDTVKTITIVIDTSRVDTSYTPKIEYRDTTIYRTLINTIMQDVDTAAILREHFAKYVYIDSILDSSYVMIITDTVTQNKIISRSIQFEMYSFNKTVETTINTEILKKESKSISIGPILTLSENTGLAGVVYLTKKRHTILGGYDFLNKGVVIGYKYKLISK